MLFCFFREKVIAASTLITQQRPVRNTLPGQTRETADKKKKEKKPLMAIFQKSQRGSLASVTIKAIFTLILGLPAEHKETTGAAIRSEGNTAVRPARPTSSKATQTAPPFTVNQRRAGTNGSQGACRRPGQLPHADQDIQSINTIIACHYPATIPGACGHQDYPIPPGVSYL